MSDVKLTQNSEPPRSGSDVFFSSGVLEALFWYPRYVVDSDLLLHVPLLFWLVGAVKPSSAAVIHTGQGAAFFAVCQAMDQLNIMGSCYGCDKWTDKVDGHVLSSPPDNIIAHADQFYPDLAILECVDDPMALSCGAQRRTLDLIFVDLRDLSEDADLLSLIDSWHTQMSSKGVLILFGINISAVQRHIDVLNSLDSYIDFDLGWGTRIILQRGTDMSRIYSLCDDASGKMIDGIINRLFRRLGQTLEARSQVKNLNSRNEELKLKATTITNHLIERQVSFDQCSANLTEAYRTIYNLNQKLNSLENIDVGLIERDVQISKLEAEAIKIRADHADQITRVEKALSEQTTRIVLLNEVGMKAQAEYADSIEQIYRTLVQQVEETKQEKATRFYETATLTDQLEKAHVRLLRQDREIVRQRKSLDILNNVTEKVSAGDARIRLLETEIKQILADYTNRITQEKDRRFHETTILTDQLEKANVQISLQIKKTRHLHQKIDNLTSVTKEINVRDKRIELLEAEVSRSSSDHAIDSMHLKNAENHVHTLMKNIELLHASTSWRITTPLRKLKSILMWK